MNRRVQSNTRQIISSVLRETKESLGKKYGHSFTLKDIDSLLQTYRDFEKESIECMSENMGNELLISRLFIGSISSICFGIESKEIGDSFFPEDWISESMKPDPDFVFSKFIVQVANYSLSVMSLAERGLDNSARALLRITNELIWEILVLVAYRDLLREYVKAETPEESTKVWYKLFGRGKLARKLSKLETELGVPDEYSSRKANLRRQNQQFYSQAVHLSFSATIYGAFGFEFDKDHLNLGILGSPSKASRMTINDLNTELDYFIYVFLLIIKRMHNLKTNLKNEWWYNSLVLSQCADRLKDNLHGKSA